MAPKRPLLCALFIENEKHTIRSIGGSILHSKQGNLIKFYDIAHVQHAVNLQNQNQIKIKTKIPKHVLLQLEDVVEPAPVETEEVENVEETEVAAITEETKEVEETEVTEVVNEEKTAEEVVTTEEVEDVQTDEQPELFEAEGVEELTGTPELPEWYLTYEQVEEMSKPELLKWAEEQAEGITLPKSKNATDTKKLVHKQLAGMFADHAE